MKLRGFLINPWKRELTELQVEDSVQAWHKLLHCQYVDVCHIGHCGRLCVDIWVDEQGFLNKPHAPLFKVNGYPNPLCGYGLVLCSDAQGETVGIPDCLTLDTFRKTEELKVEAWEKRMDPRDVDPEHII
jgi:hypothetical protein